MLLEEVEEKKEDFQVRKKGRFSWKRRRKRLSRKEGGDLYLEEDVEREEDFLESASLSVRYPRIKIYEAFKG